MPRNRIQTTLASAKGAIDLASIMVGILVIGLIGAVIAATIFMVIPWSQDKAAKDQLGSVVTAESANAGFTASAGKDAGYRFTNKQGLMNNPFGPDGSTPTKLLQVPDNVSVTVDTPGGQVIDGGNGVKFGTVWTAAIKSATGKIFYITSEDQKPKELTSGSIGGWDYGSNQTTPTDTSAPWNIEDASLRNSIASRLGVTDASTLTLADAARLNDAMFGSSPMTIGGATTLAGLEKATGLTKLNGLYVGANQDTRGLDNITQIDNVFFQGYNGTTINGNVMFPKLTTIADLNITGANNLTSISGFDSVATVSKGITVDYNGKLTSLSGFANLANTSAANIYIRNNSTLSSLTAFNNVTTVMNVQLTNSSTTSTDTFLPKLVTVNGNYFITGSAFTRISGQASLKEVKGTMDLITGNATTVTGFTGLATMGSLNLQAGNASVSAFANLTTVNSNLSGTYAKRITGTWNKLTTVGGTVNITAAGTNYATLAALKASPSSAN